VRRWLLEMMGRLPLTLCDLDVWPSNLIRRPDGEMVFLRLGVRW
jgi:hypothetical protein